VCECTLSLVDDIWFFVPLSFLSNPVALSVPSPVDRKIPIIVLCNLEILFDDCGFEKMTLAICFPSCACQK